MRGEKRAIAPAPQVIAVGESAREDDAVHALEVVVLVPEVDRRLAEDVRAGVVTRRRRSWIRGRRRLRISRPPPQSSRICQVYFSMIRLARTLSGDLGDEASRPRPGRRPAEVDLEDLALADVLDGLVAERVEGVRRTVWPCGSRTLSLNETRILTFMAEHPFEDVVDFFQVGTEAKQASISAGVRRLRRSPDRPGRGP